MSRNCDYCQGVMEEAASKCPNCGAAAVPREAPDFRFCPHCERRLLALGSPACNHCGRALPADYVRARDALWQKVSKATPGELAELEEGDDALKRALKALLDLDGKK